jgi:hypothetical protein
MFLPVFALIILVCIFDYRLENEEMLTTLGIRVHYIDYSPMAALLDKYDQKIFNKNVQWLKLWMLLLDGYRKVLFFDYDVLPLIHFDDIWHFPTPTFYEAEGAPTNGGFLLMEPDGVVFDKCLSLIALEINARNKNYHRHASLGWGRSLSDVAFPADVHLSDHSGFKFVAAFYDQGLLTHMCFFEYPQCYVAVHREVRTRVCV